MRIVKNEVTETIAAIGAVRFESLQRGSTYFYPQASHRQAFAFEVSGREYWGELIRTRPGNATRYVVEVAALYTRNARTGHGMAVREGAKLAWRAALCEAFRAHVEAFAAATDSRVTPDAPTVESVAVEAALDRTGRDEVQRAVADLPRDGEARVVGTIDCTPTWRGVLPILIAALENGTPHGRSLARMELQRMADAADRFNAETIS